MARSIFPPLLLLLLLLLNDVTPSNGGPVFDGSISPNFTVSNLLNVDTNGVFLTSPSTVFKASMCNPGKQQSRFYLCVIHSESHTIVWAANASSPVSSSGLLNLTSSGLSISENFRVVWSTGSLVRDVAAIRLLDSGNLQLVDRVNVSLWQSFDFPTDSFVSGQRIPVGRFLTNSNSDTDLSPGSYRFVVTVEDAVLRWAGEQQYWALSSDLRSTIQTNGLVSYMLMNASGLYLVSGNSVVVLEVLLPTAAMRIGKVTTDGHFTIQSYTTALSATPVDGGFVAPTGTCDLPFQCSTLGLCKVSNNASICSCPTGFRQSNMDSFGCVPSGGSLLASSTELCGPKSSNISIKYKSLSGTQYFANKFASPTSADLTLDSCQSSCSRNCSCLGFYYTSSSKLCYLLEQKLGSLISSVGDDEDVGYVKITAVPNPPSSPSHSNSNPHFLLPLLLPLVALVLLLVVLILFFIRCRRKRLSLQKYRTQAEIRLAQKSWQREVDNSTDNDEDDRISIPGLPTRFIYRDLEDATDGFKTLIGSGGFGHVYRGTLPDKSTVAVKRIVNMGVQGKKEFCTEIAVIGKIHHINLVNLRGFCAQGSRRLLVYEYMNRGSLEKSLFVTSGKPVLEWQERVNIALGAARGLAYLHSGCESKIIHCDVKPENILLHDHNVVKISDFGLAKLLSPEQSAHFTTMRGTRGYLAPEWLTNSPISDKTDVYSFGMVLLELIHGRKNCVSSNREAIVPAVSTGLTDGFSTSTDRTPASLTSEEESYFPLVALERHEEGRYVELADSRLQGRVSSVEVEKMVKIALCCLQEEPSRRPTMTTVVGMLEGTMPMLEPRLESLNFLRFYGREVGTPIVAAMAGGNNRIRLMRGGNSTGSVTSTSSSTASISYLSSEQVSGPR